MRSRKASPGAEIVRGRIRPNDRLPIETIRTERGRTGMSLTDTIRTRAIQSCAMTPRSFLGWPGFPMLGVADDR